MRFSSSLRACVRAARARLCFGGCRFLDFVHTLLDNLIANPEEELASCASRAYETTLAPRHGWILRNTIYVGFTPHGFTYHLAVQLRD
jgi:hypothetical protein